MAVQSFRTIVSQPLIEGPRISAIEINRRTFVFSVEFERKDIIHHAATTADANQIHFKRNRLGSIVQQTLVLDYAINPIKETLLRQLGKNPIFFGADKIRVPVPAYTDRPIRIQVKFRYFAQRERIYLIFRGTQQFSHRETTCLEGKATLLTGRIRKIH